MAPKTLPRVTATLQPHLRQNEINFTALKPTRFQQSLWMAYVDQNIPEPPRLSLIPSKSLNPNKTQKQEQHTESSEGSAVLPLNPARSKHTSTPGRRHEGSPSTGAIQRPWRVQSPRGRADPSPALGDPGMRVPREGPPLPKAELEPPRCSLTCRRGIGPAPAWPHRAAPGSCRRRSGEPSGRRVGPPQPATAAPHRDRRHSNLVLTALSAARWAPPSCRRSQPIRAAWIKSLHFPAARGSSTANERPAPR